VSEADLDDRPNPVWFGTDLKRTSYARAFGNRFKKILGSEAGEMIDYCDE
jgi:hypothetical protein